MNSTLDKSRTWVKPQLDRLGTLSQVAKCISIPSGNPVCTPS